MPSLKMNRRSYTATPSPPVDSLLYPFEYTVQKKKKTLSLHCCTYKMEFILIGFSSYFYFCLNCLHIVSSLMKIVLH